MSRLFTNNTTNKVTVTAAATINNLAQRTIMAWVKLASYGINTDVTWYSRGTATFADLSDGIFYPGLSHYSKVSYTGVHCYSQDDSLLDAVPLNTWTHLALTLDTATDNMLHIFVDGAEIAAYAVQTAGTVGLTDDSATNLLIGSFGAGNDSFTIDGNMYDFRLYDTVLTAVQLEEIFTGGHLADPAPINNKCHLTFYANTSPEIDATGNGNDGTITGATFSTDNPAISLLSDIISTVPFTDPQANPLASGLLILDLSNPAMVTGGGQVAPMRVTITLDAIGNIPPDTQLYGNDDLTPTGTTYHATLFNSNGAQVADMGHWSITGTSPIDLSLMVPTTNGASYPSGVYFTVQTENTILAGPATAPSAQPAFRALVDADIPVTLAGHTITGATLTTATLTSPVINGTPTGTGISTITVKRGDGGGNYARTTNTYADIDTADLSATITVPNGWKAWIVFTANGNGGAAGAGVMALADSTTVLNGAEATLGVANSANCIQYVFTGDGASHTFVPRFKGDGVNAITIINSSLTMAPAFTILLTPSN